MNFFSLHSCQRRKSSHHSEKIYKQLGENVIFGKTFLFTVENTFVLCKHILTRSLDQRFKSSGEGLALLLLVKISNFCVIVTC